jgi:DNA primase
VLYNLNNALQFIKQSNRVLLFEGYMDVIASYRAGLKESVASMGTSLTQDQVSLMKRYTNNVTICYDGDNAGMEATQRAIQLFTNANMNVKIVLFPDKLDPDDFIAKYSEEQLADFINNKWIDRLEFAYIRNQNQFDFTKMLEVEQFKKLMFDLIKKESHTVIERYLQKISQDTKISLQSIEQDFTQYTRRTPIKNTSTNQRNKVFVENKFILAERRLLNYFIKDFRYLKDFNSFREIEYLYIDEAARDLKMKIEDLYFEQKEQVKVDEERLLLEMDDQLKQYYQSKIKNEHLEYSDVEYTDCRDVLKTYLLTQKREKLERDIANATTIEEKIALAKERDAIQKEENKWIKIR